VRQLIWGQKLCDRWSEEYSIRLEALHAFCKVVLAPLVSRDTEASTSNENSKCIENRSIEAVCREVIHPGLFVVSEASDLMGHG
jgi:hypothetical protein